MAGGGTTINSVTFNPLKTIFTVNNNGYENAGSITISCSGSPDPSVYVSSIKSSDDSIADVILDDSSRAVSGNNVTTDFRVKPNSAGTVTLTATAFDNVNLRDVTGTLEITVTEGATDDESYLNKRGLTHFWKNIDDLKQNKLKAGSHITISSDNTISASQPTVGNATLTIQKNGTNVQTFTANSTSNKTANITVPTTVAELSDASTYVTQNNLTTQLANKQNVLTAGDHINITDNTIKAVDYVHSDNPVTTSQVTPVVTNDMIADGTITADKLASGATVKLTLSTSDIGEGAALAANTLYGVYI